jgi:hypothetical protein
MRDIAAQAIGEIFAILVLIIGGITWIGITIGCAVDTRLREDYWWFAVGYPIVIFLAWFLFYRK